MKKLAILALFMLLATPVLADGPYVGEIRCFAGEPPQGWVEAEGYDYQASLYPELCTYLGTTYGVAAQGYCRTPNLGGRTIVAWDDIGQPPFNVWGNSGGEISHTLTTAEMPAHNHTMLTLGNYNSGSSTYGFTRINLGAFTANTGNTGGGAAQNNMPPYLVLPCAIYLGGASAPTATPTLTPTATSTSTSTPTPTATPTGTLTPTPTPTSPITTTTYLPYISAYTTTLTSGSTLVVPVYVTFGEVILSGLVLSLVSATVLLLMLRVFR